MSCTIQSAPRSLTYKRQCQSCNWSRFAIWALLPAHACELVSMSVRCLCRVFLLRGPYIQGCPAKPWIRYLSEAYHRRLSRRRFIDPLWIFCIRLMLIELRRRMLCLPCRADYLCNVNAGLTDLTKVHILGEYSIVHNDAFTGLAAQLQSLQICRLLDWKAPVRADTLPFFQFYLCAWVSPSNLLSQKHAKPAEPFSSDCTHSRCLV